MDNYRAESTTKGDYEIDLKFFVTVFRKCWYFLILAALILGLAVGLYTSLFVPETFSSTVNMYVDPNAHSSASQLNLSTAEALAETYPPVLRHSDEFAMRVAMKMAEEVDEKTGEKLFPNWTYEEIEQNGVTVKQPKNWGRVRSMMSTGIKDSKIFYITMRSTDPKEAYYLAKNAAEVAPEVLNETVEIGTAKVIGVPTYDTVADSPSVMRNAVIAALIGAVLVYVLFFLRDLFDTTVYAAEDLSRYELPILGTVPTFPMTEERSAGKKAAKEEKQA